MSCTKSWAMLVVVITFAFALSSCSEDDESKSSTETASVAYVYVAASSASAIDGYLMDEATGRLTRMETSPFPASNVQEFRITTDGAHMAIRTGSSLLLKRIDLSTGKLTTVPGAGLVAAGMVGNMELATSGNFIYVNSDMSPLIYRYALDQDLEKITQLSPDYSTPYTPNQIAYDAVGNYLYGSSSSGQMLSMIVNANNGALSGTPTPSLPSGTNPGRPAMDPQGEFLVAYDSGTGQILLFSTQADGDLDIEGNVAVTGMVNRMRFHPAENLLYVAGAAGISVFTLDRTAGSLAELTDSPFGAGTTPLGIGFSPDGTYLLISDLSDSIVQVFALDAGGVPAEIEGSPYDTSGGGSYVEVLAAVQE